MYFYKSTYIQPSLPVIPFSLEPPLLDGSNEQIIDGGEHDW